MDAINSWQAVITELGGGQDNAAAKTTVQHALHGKLHAAHTPTSALAALGGKEVFYTPLSAIQQGTPVDAWHSILTTLTGNAKVAQGRTAGARGSTCSSTAGSPREPAAAGRSSSCGSPGMVRQLFTSSPGSFKPEQGTSSTGSTPRRLLSHARLHLKQPAGAAAAYTADRPAPGSPSSSPCKRSSSSIGPGYAERVSPFQRTLAATRQQDSPPRGMSDTQQLSDRLDALRASAESILHSAASAAGSPDGKYPGSAAGSPHGSVTATTRCLPRSGGGRSAGTLAAGSGHLAAQDASLPRRLFPPPSNPGASRSSAAGTLSSPLQRVLQSAQMSREAAAAVGSPMVGQAAAASSRAAAGAGRPPYVEQQQLQRQEPLQQQLTGAVSKVDQLLAAMVERQRSTAGGNSIVQPPHAAQASVPSHQPPTTPQLQQQEMLQQLLLQQQQLINQLLPLIPKPNQLQPAQGFVTSTQNTAGVSAREDLSATGTAGKSMRSGGLPQQHLARLLQAAARVGELQAGCGSTSPRQEGSALVIPLLSEPQPSPRIRQPTQQQLQEACSGALEVGPEAGGSAAPGVCADEQPAATATSTQGAVARHSQAVHVPAERTAMPYQVARGAGSSSGRSSGCSSVADQGIEEAEGSVSSSGSSAGGSKSRRRRWHLPLPTVAVSTPDATTAAAAAHASVTQQQRRRTGTRPSVDGSTMDETATVNADGEGVPRRAEPAAGAESAASRRWSAAGSKSMPAVGTKPEATLPDQQLPRQFWSQGPSSAAHTSSSSSLAQQLGLPQVVRFRGGASMEEGAEAAATAYRSSIGSGDGRAVSSGCSSSGADAPTADVAPTSQALPCPSPGSGDPHSSSTAGAAAAVWDGAAAVTAGNDSSWYGQSEPRTPTAALPRVHTPGRPAAEVAAELSTPQLAHSAAAVMTVSEAWREETSSIQARWLQLLAEWSASEVDTWEPQRLTEPSTLTAQHSRMSSAPGLDLSQLAAQAEDHRHHGHAQQQKQSAAAGAAGGSAQASESGLRDSQPSEGDLAGAQQQQQQEHREQWQEQLTFARLAQAHDLSPRRIPSAAALHQAPEPDAVAAVEADASEASILCSTPQQQQQQQQEAQPAAESHAPSPVWHDTARKQLFTSAAADDPSSSRSSSRDLGCTGSPDAIHEAAEAALAISTAAQTSSGAVATAAAAPAASYAGVVVANQQQVQKVQQQRQQQQLLQQEEEGLERLNQLLHDLQGLQHRLQDIHLQAPQQSLHAKRTGPAGAADACTAAAGAAGQPAFSSKQSACSRSSFSSAAAAAVVDSNVGAAATSSMLVQQHSSSACSDSARPGSVPAEGAAVTPPPARPTHVSLAAAHVASADYAEVTTLQAAPDSAADARAAAAVGRISSLKQRLQDSRAALQAIAVPSGGNEADTMQQVPPASESAATAGAGAAPSRGSSFQSSVPSDSNGISAPSANRSHDGSAAAAAASEGATSTAAAAPVPSAWLTGGSLQQYLGRRSSTCWVSSTGLGAGSSETLGNLASVSSALPAVRDRPSGRTVLSGGGSAGSGSTSSSHVQALVSKWRAAAAAQQETQPTPGTLLQQQQQRKGMGDAGLSTLQALLAQVQTGGAAAAHRVSEVVGGATAHSSPLPHWLGSGLPGSRLQQLITSKSGGGAGTAESFKTAQAAPGFAAPLGQTTLQGGLGTKTVGSTGSARLRSTGSRMQTAPGAGGAWSIHNPLFQQTPLSTPPEKFSRRADCYSSGSKGGNRSRAIAGTATVSGGSNGRTAVRCSSTPPSAGNLARWTQHGSPTRQLRQQLQEAAQQFQLQEQERQQQLQAAVQVMPVSASLAKSFATLDRTLAGLRSVSPAAAAATGRSAGAALPAGPPYVLTAPSGLSLSSRCSGYSGGNCSSAGGTAGGRMVAAAGGCSVRSAADILAGTAAAAEAVCKAQAAAVRPVSPVQMLHRQQEMLASIGMLGQPPIQDRGTGYGLWR